ncbi:10216_t:CDS:10 [Ambispora leptoticha]|uniref:10216_t:CDS:1 n=1 Tax=Ambispora leptoticha TaxID=144679 RepID=A0A9N9AHY2_9GLOM|nr:10216_t:CDS:10 [Ambispora leptoticha]
MSSLRGVSLRFFRPTTRILRPAVFLSPNATLFNTNLLISRGISTIELRPYQKECIKKCMDKFLKEKVKRQIVSLPVGNLIKEIPEPFPGANKVLVVAHRQELLDQAHKHISQRLPDSVVEIDQGNRRAVGFGDIIIASVQSLVSQKSQRMEKYDPKQFKAIIIDEAHHAAAMTYRKIFEYFGADSEDTHLFVWGCSATIRRHDGLALQSLFDEITFHRDFLDMIREKWLCNIKVTTIKTEIDLSKVKTLNGDFVASDLSKKVNVPGRNKIIVGTYLKYAANRKSTLVFAVDIEHIKQLTEEFRGAGIEAHGVSSHTHKNVRSHLLNEFKAGKFPVLVAYLVKKNYDISGILTEGTDIPNIDCILMSRPTKSAVLFQQMMGRGMRRAEEKENCLIIDYVDSYTKFHDVKTLPTLFGLCPEEELENQDPLEYEPKEEEGLQHESLESPESPVSPELEEKLNSGELLKDLQVTEWDNPFELLEDCSGDVPFGEISINAWVKVGADMYVLSMRGGTTLKLAKNEKIGLYEAKLKITTHNFQRLSLSLPITSDNLDHAIKACDTWVESNMSVPTRSLVRRSAAWRSDPITSEQKKVLIKSASKIEKWTDIEKIDTLTKGQAANMITCLKEGAVGNWKRTQKQIEIQKKKEMKEMIRVQKIQKKKEIEIQKKKIKEMKHGPISEGRLSSLQC